MSTHVSFNDQLLTIMAPGHKHRAQPTVRLIDPILRTKGRRGCHVYMLSKLFNYIYSVYYYN
ncbi:hypothetical protein DPEC_G00166060 [Dallia pectoralis]|uniref:Uncharacterized protein n=1 Tax=Dallia pectoralis TaxID=75939 RepID=A0ACC2GH86_DALPE|nr:hypothetical protein DPEC_G00166060 [Dallia pectoralis]